MSASKKVFISYAGDNLTWVHNFTDDVIFRNIIGRDLVVTDYADTVNVGSIKEWLNSQVDGAAAVVAFLSKQYIDKPFTLAELWRSVTQHRQRHLFFVPVIMHADAIGWWNRQKLHGPLKELAENPGDSYAYADFTYRGEPVDIVSNGRFNDTPARRIGELAALIKERLRELDGPEIVEGPGGPKEKPHHNDQDGSDDRVEGTGSAELQKPVVILGHASAPMPTEVASASAALELQLKQRNVQVTRLKDQWAAQAQEHKQVAAQLVEQSAIFVQPLGPGDAGEAVQNTNRERDRLKKLVGRESPTADKVEHCRLVLWLPAGLDDDDFTAAKAFPPTSHTTDSAENLAELLGTEVGIDRRPMVPVIMLEDLSENPRLRNNLAKEFGSVIGQKVRPQPDTYEFAVSAASRMLERQMAQVPGDRVILAINDLNVGGRKAAEARRSLEDKLGAFSERVRNAQQAAGRHDLKLFWSALIVRNSSFLPYVRHPSPQFDEWHFLGFEGEDHNCKPEPTYCQMFLNYLNAWVHS